MIKLKSVIALFLAACCVFSIPAFAAGHAKMAVQQKAVRSGAAVKVNINEASASELAAIEGMSAYKAHAIVSYRKKQGSFKSLDELGKVKGFQHIKAEKLQAFTQQLSV